MHDTDDTRTERRLEREAMTHCCGTLGVPLEEATDTARVEVSWTNEHGTDHAGFYFVNVVCREVVQVGLDGASHPMRRWRDELDKPEHLRHVVTDDDELANHPATLASELANERLAERAERFGWSYYSVDDVSAY